MTDKPYDPSRTNQNKNKSSTKTTGTGSEQLPHAKRGATHSVSNPNTVPLVLQPAEGDQIEDNEVGAPYSLAPGKHVVFHCKEEGVWEVTAS